jgi:3'-phosphoadenosine 5'-phosphosulfate sulfotransferase (PAPS reductase)/FAD synthetase
MSQARFSEVDTPVEELVEEALSILMEAKELYKPVKTYVLTSGGNDSTTLMHLIRPYVDAAVHIRTGIGIPETSEFVREVTASFGLDLIELVTPPEVYRDIVLGETRKGFPGPNMHYITYHRLKAERIRNLQRDYSKRGERLLLVSGVRSQESQRRMLGVGKVEHQAPTSTTTRCAWVNPIVHWTSFEMMGYRSAFDVPRSPVADKIHKSGECLCGAFATRDELKELEFWYPETANYIKSLEAEAKALGKKFPYWGHRAGKRPTATGPLCSDCLFNLDEIP